MSSLSLRELGTHRIEIGGVIALLIGPVFSRELVITPRRPRIYLARTSYVAALTVLMATAWLILTGTQLIRDVGDLARFGTILFQILSPLQLGLAVFFSAMFAASAVSQEKDRRTLELLLLTNLSNSELVLGKLLASLLYVLVMLGAALPLFMFAALLGGVSFGQIGRVFGVTLASVLMCGSMGSTIALWREKTFQSLAVTVLVLVLWLAVGEMVGAGIGPERMLGLSSHTWAVAISPWQAVLEATRPYLAAEPGLWWLGTPLNLFFVLALLVSLVINGLAIALVRVWNPSREARIVGQEEDSWNRGEAPVASPLAAGLAGSAPARESFAPQPVVRDRRAIEASDKSPAVHTRHVWNNPIIWREVCTWAYGRKTLVIRLAYLMLFALFAASVTGLLINDPLVASDRSTSALVALFLLSLVLINAQAVTALTSERDARALDLLLVTDLTPKEILFGKLGGVLYNTKEMILLPMLMCGFLWFSGRLAFENLLYLLGGLAVLTVFVAMLGIHAGMIYVNSRQAIGTSLGTVFFLFVGVAVCMRMMVAFSGSFQVQLLPFFAFIFIGGVGLYVALGARNPSAALGVAAGVCPLATFHAITSYLLEHTLGVFLVTVAAYGFATAAMMVPAIYEFDVATGRAASEES